MKVLSLFSGIGAFEKALENIGVEYELINYCEVDKYASKAFSLIHNLDENLNLGDITKIETITFPNDIDIITYGFPCQDISNAGKQKGFTDDNGDLTRSGLFFEALRIIEDTQPKFAIAENVKALTGKRFTAEFKIVLDSLNEAGYKNYWAVLNAKDYGIPQNRERVFIISIRKDIDHGFDFPEPYELKLTLADLLEETVDKKYFVEIPFNQYENGTCRTIKSQYQHSSYANFIKTGSYGATGVLIREATKKGYAEAYDGDYVNLQFPNSKTRRGRVGKRISQTLLCSGENGVVVKKDEKPKIRKLTPKECFRLMGFDDMDVDILIDNDISNTQLYKMAGNSIVVDVLEEIYRQLFSQYPNATL